MKRISLLVFGILFMANLNAISAQDAWKVLGSAKVNGAVDHDEIWVTHWEGDFTAVKLVVENEGINFDRVVLHFGNGGQEELNIRHFIPAGGETRALDLKGHERVIKKVDFYYESDATTKTKAKVILYGRR